MRKKLGCEKWKNIPGPPPDRPERGMWCGVKPVGVISDRLAVVSLDESQVSEIPRISKDLLTTRSDRTGALSRMERVFIVPILMFRVTGPRFTATSRHHLQGAKGEWDESQVFNVGEAAVSYCSRHWAGRVLRLGERNLGGDEQRKQTEKRDRTPRENSYWPVATSLKSQATSAAVMTKILIALALITTPHHN